MGAKTSTGILSTVFSDMDTKNSDSVSLHSCGISDKEILQLALLLKGNRTVHELRLKNCFVNHIGAKYIANVLSDTSINRLFLSCNVGIRDRGALALLSTLPQSNLVELSLDTTNITDRTVHGLASILPQCQLEVLYLGGNDISDFGARLLADVLPQSCITRLYLSSCKIRDLGVKSLALAMKQTRLEVLTLSANYITDVGAKCLAEGANACPTLEKLDLSCNDVTDESVAAFYEAISRHVSIRMVCFQYTAASVAQVQKLDWKIASLHSDKARLMTLLCSSSFLKTGRTCFFSSFPIELIRYISNMLFR